MCDFADFVSDLLHYARYEADPGAWVMSYPDGFWDKQYTMWQNGVRDARICDATCAVMTEMA